MTEVQRIQLILGRLQQYLGEGADSSLKFLTRLDRQQYYKMIAAIKKVPDLKAIIAPVKVASLSLTRNLHRVILETLWCVIFHSDFPLSSFSWDDTGIKKVFLIGVKLIYDVLPDFADTFTPRTYAYYRKLASEHTQGESTVQDLRRRLRNIYIEYRHRN